MRDFNDTNDNEIAPRECIPSKPDTLDKPLLTYFPLSVLRSLK